MNSRQERGATIVLQGTAGIIRAVDVLMLPGVVAPGQASAGSPSSTKFAL